jgi:HEAT repeat protein
VATVKVTQNQKLENQTGLFSMPIVFRFGFADGSTRDFKMLVNEKENSYHFSFAEKPVMFTFDPDNWVLKTLDLSVPQSMLLHQLSHDSSVIGRVHAAQALSRIGGADVVKALEEAVDSAFFWGVSAEAARALATIGSTAARDALLRQAAHSNALVRRVVVGSLGSWKDQGVAKLLAGIVSGAEKSVFVKAEAAAALGRTRSPLAFDVLRDALSIESWNQTIRVGVLNGLSELGDERAIALAAEHAGADKPFQSRPAAIGALGKLGAKLPKAVEHLHALADAEDTQQFTLFMALVGALGESKQRDSVPVLSKLSASAGDGRIKHIIAETIESLQTGGGESKTADELRAQVEKLTVQVRDLTDKLDAHSVSETHHKHGHKHDGESEQACGARKRKHKHKHKH